MGGPKRGKVTFAQLRNYVNGFWRLLGVKAGLCVILSTFYTQDAVSASVKWDDCTHLLDGGRD